jgi:hypothetical protein
MAKCINDSQRLKYSFGECLNFVDVKISFYFLNFKDLLLLFNNTGTLYEDVFDIHYNNWTMCFKVTLKLTKIIFFVIETHSHISSKL